MEETREYYLENNKYYVKEEDSFVSIVEKPILIFDFLEYVYYKSRYS